MGQGEVQSSGPETFLSTPLCLNHANTLALKSSNRNIIPVRPQKNLISDICVTASTQVHVFTLTAHCSAASLVPYCRPCTEGLPTDLPHAKAITFIRNLSTDCDFFGLFWPVTGPYMCASSDDRSLDGGAVSYEPHSPSNTRKPRSIYQARRETAPQRPQHSGSTAQALSATDYLKKPGAAAV